MLSGQLRDHLDTKGCDLSVLLYRRGQSLLDLAGLLLQTFDLTFTRVGDRTDIAQLVAAALELGHDPAPHGPLATSTAPDGRGLRFSRFDRPEEILAGSSLFLGRLADVQLVDEP
jgi:hypothetical protein